MSVLKDWEGAGNLQSRAASLVNDAGSILTQSTTQSLQPSARSLRIRVCTGPIDGPHWLTLLSQCAWVSGIVPVFGKPSEVLREPESWKVHMTYESFLAAQEVQGISTGSFRTKVTQTETGVRLENEHGQVVDMSREEYEGRRNGTWKTYPSHGY